MIKCKQFYLRFFKKILKLSKNSYPIYSFYIYIYMCIKQKLKNLLNIVHYFNSSVRGNKKYFWSHSRANRTD